jgi:hypothetical protein
MAHECRYAGVNSWKKCKGNEVHYQMLRQHTWRMKFAFVFRNEMKRRIEGATHEETCSSSSHFSHASFSFLLNAKKNTEKSSARRNLNHFEYIVFLLQKFFSHFTQSNQACLNAFEYTRAIFKLLLFSTARNLAKISWRTLINLHV